VLKSILEKGTAMLLKKGGCEVAFVEKEKDKKKS